MRSLSRPAPLPPMDPGAQVLSPVLAPQLQKRVRETLEPLCAVLDGGLLGLFMISACLSTWFFEHPESPLHQALATHPFARRAGVGVLMGLTAWGLIESPAGRRSGAHMNPAVTLTMARLGQLSGRNAVLYMVGQFTLGALGVALSALIVRGELADPHVEFAVTIPGSSGPRVAFLAELAISFALMLTVLLSSHHPRLRPHTPTFAATLVALFVTFEAPLSGMSMNPARSLASALFSAHRESLWIYFVAPPLGMWLAAEAYLQNRRIREPLDSQEGR